MNCSPWPIYTQYLIITKWKHVLNIFGKVFTPLSQYMLLQVLVFPFMFWGWTFSTYSIIAQKTKGAQIGVTLSVVMCYTCAGFHLVSGKVFHLCWPKCYFRSGWPSALVELERCWESYTSRQLRRNFELNLFKFEWSLSFGFSPVNFGSYSFYSLS